MVTRASLRTNFVYNLIYQVVSLITPLVTAPYVARVLGAEGVGIYSYTQSIVIYFTLIGGLGSNTHGRREIAASRDNQQMMSNLFYEIMILRAVTVFVSIVLFWGFILLNGSTYRLYFALQTIDLISILFDISWFYQGIEEFKKTATRQILVKVAGVCAILLLVKKESDIPIYILCYSIPVLLGNLFLWPGIKGKLCIPDKKNVKPFRHFKSEITLFIPYVATLLYSYVDKTMLGSLADSKAEVGYYAQAFKFIAIAVAVVSAMADVMTPRIANNYKLGHTDMISDLSHKATQVIFAMSFFIFTALFSIGPNLIPWFLGTEYTRSIVLLQILAFLVIVKGINNFCGNALLVATYHQNLYSKCIWITTLFNIAVNAVLIPRIGALGACIATVLSEYLLFVMQLFYTREYLDIKQMLYAALKYIVASLVVSIVILFTQRFMKPNPLNTIVLGGMSGGLYIFILWMLRDDIVLTIFYKAKDFLRKKGIYSCRSTNRRR